MEKQNDNRIGLVDINDVPVISAVNLNATGRVKAYFSTRLGGVSQGKCGAMNLNLFKDSDNANARINMKLFCSAIGVDPKILVANREKHTDIVTIVGKDSIKSDFYNPDLYQNADGMITNSRDVCLFVYSSDCAVFLFFDPINNVIAATHVGWRGSLNGIVGKTVQLMHDQFNCNAEDILVAVGPSIGPCCFEVDEAVKNLFLAYNSNFEKYIFKGTDKFHIDLHKINKQLLISSGIPECNIASSDYCTMCDDKLFHSFRREKGANGVNGAFLQLLE